MPGYENGACETTARKLTSLIKFKPENSFVEKKQK